MFSLYAKARSYNSCFITYYFRRIYLFFMRMSVCLDVCMYTACLPCLRRPEEGGRYSGNSIIHGCKLMCGWREPNQAHLQEQQVLFTFEPSLYPLSSVFLWAKAAQADITPVGLLLPQSRMLELQVCTSLPDSGLLAISSETFSCSRMTQRELTRPAGAACSLGVFDCGFRNESYSYLPPLFPASVPLCQALFPKTNEKFFPHFLLLCCAAKNNLFFKDW